MKTIRSYSELIKIPTFLERYRYLRQGAMVGESTFGFTRYLNQVFYRSREWRTLRDYIIVRDNGCDLAFVGHEVTDRIIVHHMNPLTLEDIEDRNPDIMDPRFLICTSHMTHEAITFGDERLLPKPIVERRPGDTCPWK